MNLSPNAQKLYEALKSHSLWEQDAIKVLFPEPEYAIDKDAYWQWDANLYGQNQTRPDSKGVNREFLATDNYSGITYSAMQELKQAGLAYVKNAGYNNYSYHAK